METAVKKLERSSLRVQAARLLRADIITGQIQAGRLHTVGEFAQRFGVSATPVREALGDLAAAGLVEVVRNRGFAVPVLNERDLDEIFELRLMLEVPAVERAAGRLGVDQLEYCRSLVQAGKVTAQACDFAAFLEADRAFHHELLNALGNRRLAEIIDRLRDQARLYGLLALGEGGQLSATSAEEHEALLDAIERGDSAAARRCMTNHLRHTRGAWAGNEEPEAFGADRKAAAP